MIKVGDIITILKYKYAGQKAVVTKIEMDAGAANGWYTVELPDGTTLMYAGEEIRL